LVVVTANWQIGKDQKHSNKCRCPPAQPSQEKRPQEHQITAITPEDSTIFSSSSSVTDSCGIVPLFTRNQDTTSTIPSSTSTSATRSTSRFECVIGCSPEQTSTVPPQDKVLIITSLPMTLISANHNYLCNFSVDIIPSATLADQPIVPTVSSSQMREIALKQVSYLISIFLHHQYLIIK
jgi:hypothetical protein